MPVTPEDIERRVSDAVFGNKLITNVFRGHVVEAMVAEALEPDWTWCSHDYASCDFDREDGVRLEVKQSAALQSWAVGPPNKISASFDIAPRKGYWEGFNWIPRPGRRAHVYVFAFHSNVDETADHRDPEQWKFYVIRADDLPNAKTISLGPLRRLTEPCSFAQLHEQVAKAARGYGFAKRYSS